MAYTYAQAAKRLGWSMRTFTKWREAAGIEGKTPAYYGNRRLLSDEDVEAIRRCRAEAREEAGFPVTSLRSLPPLSDPLPPYREVSPRPPRRISSYIAQNSASLPPGWMAFTSWCDDHHINPRSAERLVAAGRLPQPHRSDEGWRGPTGQRIVRAYDAEQHQAASRIASQEWPERWMACEDCGSLPEE